MPAPDLKSLFEGILTTQGLQAQQQAQEQQALQYYAQQSDRPWQFLLERSLNQAGAALPNSIQNQQKAQAAANEEVLKRSTARYGQMVQEGADPGKAQLDVLDSAISEFAQQGNYQAISNLAPTYLALQAKQAELAKLAQEEKTSYANELKLKAQAEAEPILAANTKATGESTRALQAKQGQKIDQELKERETVNIIDLTSPESGPIATRIDPTTGKAQGVNGMLEERQYRLVGKEGADGKGGGRPPSPEAVKQLTGAGSAVRTAVNLKTEFKPEFGGYKSEYASDADLMVKRRLFKSSEAADWWMTKQASDNVLINQLFGASQTAGEFERWKKASPTPADSPALIQKKLAQQEAAAKDAARKLQKGYSSFLGEEVVNSFMFGDNPIDLSTSPAKASAPAAPAIDSLMADPKYSKYFSK